MENMNSEGSQVVFLSLRNLEKLLVPGESNRTAWDSNSKRGAKQVVNSQVIHLSFAGIMPIINIVVFLFCV